jgi:hypothetical protein
MVLLIDKSVERRRTTETTLIRPEWDAESNRSLAKRVKGEFDGVQLVKGA